MPDIKTYKCPCCNAGIEFNIFAQKLKCPYCETEFDIETLDSYEQEVNEVLEENLDWEETPNSEWGEDAENLREYVCNSCGGQIITDATTAATHCPYCSNPVIMAEKVSGVLRPDYIIPFAFDKKAATNALKKHYGGKRLLPKVFKDQNHIDEVKGVYVPVWLFDTDVNAHIRYKATKVRHWSDSKYDYTETSHYSVSRNGGLSFNNVPVDGSTKMDDTLMESIEPFAFSKAVEFKTAYLSGFLADKYDVDSDSSKLRANERIKRSTQEEFAATANGYTTITTEACEINLSNSKAKYALYPVWLLNTSWNGERFYFAMNGQTGKFAGDLPLDKKALFKWLFGLTAAIGSVAFAISYLLWML